MGFNVCLWIFSGVAWKFVPSKFTRPPKEFRVYGNEVRQTVLDNFLVPRNLLKGKSKKKKIYQSRITQFFKWNVFCIIYSIDKNIFVVISDFMIMEGKAAVYKRGYIEVLRHLRILSKENKRLKKEVRRLSRMHEDFVFSLL